MSQSLGQVYASEYNGSGANGDYATCVEKRNVNIKIQEKSDSVIAAFTRKVVDNTVMIKHHGGNSLPGAAFQPAAAPGVDIFNSDVGGLATGKTYNTKHNGKLNTTMPGRLYLSLDNAYDPTATPLNGFASEIALRFLDKDGNELAGGANEGIMIGNWVMDKGFANAEAGKLIVRYHQPSKTHFLLPFPPPSGAPGHTFEVMLDYHTDWIEAPQVSL
jgi:hypothetical protein